MFKKLLILALLAIVVTEKSLLPGNEPTLKFHKADDSKPKSLSRLAKLLIGGGVVTAGVAATLLVIFKPWKKNKPAAKPEIIGETSTRDKWFEEPSPSPLPTPERTQESIISTPPQDPSGGGQQSLIVSHDETTNAGHHKISHQPTGPATAESDEEVIPDLFGGGGHDGGVALTAERAAEAERVRALQGDQPKLFFVPVTTSDEASKTDKNSPPFLPNIFFEKNRFRIELLGPDLNILLRPPCFCGRAAMIAISDLINSGQLNLADYSNAILALARDYQSQPGQQAPWQGGTTIQRRGGDDLRAMLHPTTNNEHSALASDKFVVNLGGEFHADSVGVNFAPIKEKIQKFVTTENAELVMLVIHKDHYFIAQLFNKVMINGKQLLQARIFETAGMTTSKGATPTQQEVNKAIVERLAEYTDETKIKADFLQPVLDYFERIAREMPAMEPSNSQDPAGPAGAALQPSESHSQEGGERISPY